MVQIFLTCTFLLKTVTEIRVFNFILPGVFPPCMLHYVPIKCTYAANAVCFTLYTAKEALRSTNTPSWAHQMLIIRWLSLISAGHTSLFQFKPYKPVWFEVIAKVSEMFGCVDCSLCIIEELWIGQNNIYLNI